MSEYDIIPGGSLKLKGGVTDGGIVKKYVLFRPFGCSWRWTGTRKKKKSKSKAKVDAELDREREYAKKVLLDEDGQRDSGSPSLSNRNSPGIVISSERKTEAEKRFEEVQKRRVS